MLTIPETWYDLESIRPDHLYLIVLSRQLILWDYIYATPHYLISLLPNICKDSLSIREDEISILNTLLGQLSQQFHKEDAMSDIFIGTIMILFAGAVSIGLRYAGTFDLQAYNLVRDLFLGLEKIVPTSISMYLGLLPLSLSLIMAGSGNLELFRILRRLHKSIRHKSDASNSLYANYMMNSMSIGFLFLGGGSCSFQTSPLAIASLLCALYPIFPVSPVDNQYHLQAFRHLYILAAENRLLETRDIRTNKACFVPLEITLKETKDYYSTTCRLMSPCLVPDWNSIEKIEIRGPRYLPQTHWITRECFLQRNTLSHQVRQRRRTKSSSDRSNASIKVEYGRTTIFVRRRMGQLDYSIDPKGTRGLVSRVTAVSLKGQMLTCSWQSLYSFPISIDSARDEIAMDALMEYPSLAGFFQYFCDPSKPCIYDAILYEILAQDKPETLTLYLEMMHIYHSVEEYSLHSLSMKHFHILSQYFHYRPCLNYYRKGHNDSLNSIMMDHYQEENIPIIEPAFVEMCFRRVKNAFEKIDWSVFESAMVVTQDKYSSPTRNIMKDNPTLWNQKCLWMYLQLMQIPTSKVMRQLYRDLQQTIATTNRRSTRMIQWWLSQQLPINYQHNIPLLSQLLKAMLERNITS